MIFCHFKGYGPFMEQTYQRLKMSTIVPVYIILCIVCCGINSMLNLKQIFHQKCKSLFKSYIVIRSMYTLFV